MLLVAIMTGETMDVSFKFSEISKTWVVVCGAANSRQVTVVGKFVLLVGLLCSEIAIA